MSYRNYKEYLMSRQFQEIAKMLTERSGGICEMCHKEKATHRHHVKYPPWGEYEKDASGLLHLCHACHYKIHEREIVGRNK